MDLPALRMQQSGKTLYLTQMTVGQVDSCAITAEWDPDLGWDIERQGFQRAPVAQHYEAIGHFLATSPDPFIPTAALLSAEESQQGKLRFKTIHDSAGLAFGTLQIPEGRQLLILDYQHRLRGLRFAIEALEASHLRDFTMPVTIIADIPRYEEIRQFYLINSKQKRIDSGLALTLLQTLGGDVPRKELENFVGAGKRHRIRANPLTFKLAARPGGPWAGRIAQPHDLAQPNAVIRLPSFVDSLAPVVSRRETCSRLDDEPLLDVLNNFWSGVRAIAPEAFANPTGYLIQKSVGVYALHLVFARGAFPACERSGSFSTKSFQQVLMPAASKYLNEKFWRSGGEAKVYVGSSGYRELAKLIMEKIPQRG